MRFPNSKSLLRLAAVITAGLVLAGCQDGRVAYAITNTNTLISFQTDNATRIDSEVSFTGLAANETVVQIDFRPANEQLYGLTSNNRIVTIDPTSGAATLVSTTPFTTATLVSPVMDVNAIDDYLRVISSSSGSTAAFNGRVNPTNGMLIQTDAAPIFDPDDVNDGEVPQLAAIAYTNSRTNATTTTLYGLEVTTQTLVRITNAGVLTTVGALDRGFVSQAGFDIVRDRGDQDNDEVGTPYVIIAPRGGTSRFYNFNLSSANTSQEDRIDGDRIIRGMAVDLNPPERNGFAL